MGYKYQGKTYTFRAQLPNGNTLYANDEDKLRKAVEKKYGKDAWSWGSTDNGFSYTVHLKQKKDSSNKLVKKPTAAQISNQRRNNYNQQAQYYGFNSRNDVRKMQQTLLKLGYSLGTSGPNKDGVDGYMGNFTEAAYLAAWQKHPEEMKKAGFKEPSTPGTPTVKVGNREAVATEQNMRQAAKVADADEFVRENYGSDAQFQTMTLGLTQLLSPTADYAYLSKLIKAATNDDYTFREVFNDFLTGKQNGIFENGEAMQKWAAEHPKAAVVLNMLADTAVGMGIKTGPKLKATTNAIKANMSEGITTSLENSMPRLQISRFSYKGVPKGNARINTGAARQAQVQTDAILTGKQTPSGRIISDYTGQNIGSPVEMTYVYGEPRLPFYVDPIAYGTAAPMGTMPVIDPYQNIPSTPSPTLQMVPAGNYEIDGQAPYQTTWYKDPLAPMPDATQFKFGGKLRKFKYRF